MPSIGDALGDIEDIMDCPLTPARCVTSAMTANVGVAARFSQSAALRLPFILLMMRFSSSYGPVLSAARIRRCDATRIGQPRCAPLVHDRAIDRHPRARRARG